MADFHGFHPPSLLKAWIKSRMVDNHVATKTLPYLFNKITLFDQRKIILNTKLGADKFLNVYELQKVIMLEWDIVVCGKGTEKRLCMHYIKNYCTTENVQYVLKHIEECHLMKNGKEAYTQAVV